MDWLVLAIPTHPPRTWCEPGVCGPCSGAAQTETRLDTRPHASEEVQDARHRVDDPTSSTPGLGTSEGAGERRLRRRAGGRRCYKLHTAAAPVEDRGRRTWKEPAAGVMDRRRSGQSPDSESRSLRPAGLAQPAGPPHSSAPNGLRRGTTDSDCRTGSMAVETTASRV
jgi:hypothetical protein